MANPADENVFKEIEEAAPNMMFRAGTSDPIVEKQAEGIREELFGCFLVAAETARLYHTARMSEEGLDKQTLSLLNKRGVETTIRLNNILAAIMSGEDPRDVAPNAPGPEENPDDPEDLITDL